MWVAGLLLRVACVFLNDFTHFGGAVGPPHQVQRNRIWVHLTWLYRHLPPHLYHGLLPSSLGSSREEGRPSSICSSHVGLQQSPVLAPPSHSCHWCETFLLRVWSRAGWSTLTGSPHPHLPCFNISTSPCGRWFHIPECSLTPALPPRAHWKMNRPCPHLYLGSHVPRPPTPTVHLHLIGFSQLKTDC